MILVLSQKVLRDITFVMAAGITKNMGNTKFHYSTCSAKNVETINRAVPLKNSQWGEDPLPKT